MVDDGMDVYTYLNQLNTYQVNVSGFDILIIDIIIILEYFQKELKQKRKIINMLKGNKVGMSKYRTFFLIRKLNKLS